MQFSLSGTAGEAIIPAVEVGKGGGDGGEVAEVELEEVDLAGGVWVEGVEFVDGAGGFAGGAAGDPDGGVVGVEEGGDFEAEAGICWWWSEMGCEKGRFV